jgi:hypothetical protein
MMTNLVVVADNFSYQRQISVKSVQLDIDLLIYCIFAVFVEILANLRLMSHFLDN